jgi:hypothetical protein
MGAGWLRINLEVDDLVAVVEELKAAGVRFGNEIVQDNGGQQILIEDSSGIRASCSSPRVENRPRVLAGQIERDG